MRRRWDDKSSKCICSAVTMLLQLSHFVAVMLSDVPAFVEPSAEGGQKSKRERRDTDTRRELNRADGMA